MNKINLSNLSDEELLLLAQKLNVPASEVFTRSEDSVILRNQIFNLVEKYPDSQTCLYDIEKTYLHISPIEVLSLKIDKYRALYDYSGEVLCLVTQPIETFTQKTELDSLSIILRKEIKNLSKSEPTNPAEMQ